MSRKIFKIIKINSELDTLLVYVGVNSNVLTHVEYYVGVDKSHPLYQENTTYAFSDLIKHKVTKEFFFTLGRQRVSTNTIKNSLYEWLRLLEFSMNRDKKAIKEYIKLNGVKALDYAYLSYIGNHYDFLYKNKCYFGGSFYVPNFGKKSCEFSAIKIAKELENYLINKQK